MTDTARLSVYDEIGLDLSMRAYNALYRNDIRTYAQLLERSDAELLRMRNFGPKALAELKAHLADLGFIDADGERVPTPTDLEPARWLGERITQMAGDESNLYPAHTRRRIAAHRALAIAAGYDAKGADNDGRMLYGTLSLHLAGLNETARRAFDTAENGDTDALL